MAYENRITVFFGNNEMSRNKFAEFYRNDPEYRGSVISDETFFKSAVYVYLERDKIFDFQKLGQMVQIFEGKIIP